MSHNEIERRLQSMIGNLDLPFIFLAKPKSVTFK